MQQTRIYLQVIISVVLVFACDGLYADVVGQHPLTNTSRIEKVGSFDRCSVAGVWAVEHMTFRYYVTGQRADFNYDGIYYTGQVLRGDGAAEIKGDGSLIVGHATGYDIPMFGTLGWDLRLELTGLSTGLSIGGVRRLNARKVSALPCY